MTKVGFDEESFRVLPNNAVSPEVYFLDNDKLEKVNEVNSKDKKKNKTPTTGGDSLLRSTNEEISSTMISCTITIKEKDNGEFVHEEILDALPTQTSNNPQTFVVRSAEDFVSDSDPNYLEFRHPDLLTFGRG